MSEKIKTIMKMTLVGGLLIVAVAMGFSRIHYLTTTGEEGLQVWFYDQSEGELYTVSRETIPPHKGIGGEKNDGVRAVVVAYESERQDPNKRRIAYLETYTQEHKQLLEDLQSARVSGQAYGKPIPNGESGFYEKNTLVCRVDDPIWYDMTTAEAKRIVREWQKERGPDGKALVVCTP